MTNRDEDTDISFFNADALIGFIESGKAESYLTGAALMKEPAVKSKSFEPTVGDMLAAAFGKEIDRAMTVTLGTVYTPQGTPVTTFYDLSWSEMAILQGQPGLNLTAAKAESFALMAIYTSATQLAPPSPSYNCHSFAWYLQSSNKHWINSPADYINDGSYVWSSTASTGKKVIYSNSVSGIVHSGVVSASGTSLSTTSIRSKWGYLGVYDHYADDCPYYGTGTSIGYWQLNPAL